MMKFTLSFSTNLSALFVELISLLDWVIKNIDPFLWLCLRILLFCLNYHYFAWFEFPHGIKVGRVYV